MLPQKKSQLRRNAWYRQQLLQNGSGGIDAGSNLAIAHNHFGHHRVAENNPATIEPNRISRTGLTNEVSQGDQA